MYRLLKIDELLLPEHKYLTTEDECYYFMEYRPGIRDKTGSIIMNFKKSPAQKNQDHYKYKIKEIKSIAAIFREALPIKDDTILVPIPPSKRRDHPDFDDRGYRMLKIYCGQDPNADIRDIFSAKKNIGSFHDSMSKPSFEELLANMEMDIDLCANKKSNIILVDDVITNGTHFKVCKSLLKQQFPDSTIIGVFIARRVHDGS